tara:strand:- start:2208 stop:2597 length:390 start_codon:yes stop_codon:yes gene_type:complete
MESTQMSDELYQFLACDYSATGEGRTLCLLITRAYPHSDDYETHGGYNDGVYTPPVMKAGHSAKVRAAREFAEEFGGYYLQGAENLSREEFLKRFGNHLPPYTEKILNPEPGEGPGNFNLKLQIHLNFS